MRYFKLGVTCLLGIFLLTLSGTGAGCSKKGEEGGSKASETKASEDKGGKNEETKQEDGSAEAESEDSEDKVGAGDVVDYATGKTQLEEKEKMEKKINEAEKKKKEQMEDLNLND